MIKDYYILNYINYILYTNIKCLYHPTLVVFSVDSYGEVERERFINEHDIYRYDAYEYNFNIDGELYTAILINND